MQTNDLQSIAAQKWGQDKNVEVDQMSWSIPTCMYIEGTWAIPTILYITACFGYMINWIRTFSTATMQTEQHVTIAPCILLWLVKWNMGIKQWWISVRKWCLGNYGVGVTLALQPIAWEWEHNLAVWWYSWLPSIKWMTSKYCSWQTSQLWIWR